ncbi:MAG: hypothetical protein PHV68_04530 [Candidatus Gastranaerophilales bacterium]|nr:hypothetical protein [Candidatus Gastranaerophilales bacterium]
MFEKRLRNVCEKCLQVENEEVDKIINYVRSQKEFFVSIKVLSNETGISVKEIEDLYKDSRFVSIANRISFHCKSCGVEIRDKEKKVFFCDECAAKMGIDPNSRGTAGSSDTVDPRSILKQFDKNIMHSQKNSSKFGFKKDYE